MGPCREITRREVIALVVGACVLAVAMTWPLVLHLGTHVPKDLGDPLVQAWQVAWGGHALAHQPLDFFQSNQFWPLPDTLAFSDALIGYAPAGLIGSGTEAAVARYDLLFLFTYALAFAGTYLLARELGIGIGGAIVAGAAFAFAPFRLEQDGHMHIISSGGIPLAAALGVRGYRLRRPAWVLAGWAVATWQVTLGFSLGIPLAYLLAAIGIVAAIAWLGARRPRLERRLVAATVAGAALFVAVGALLAQPYLRVADEHETARRTPGEVEAFSAPASGLLVAPEENLVWGAATEPLRDGLANVPEKTLFPGLVTLCLALAGLWSPSYPRRLRIGLAAGAIAFAILALGLREGDGLLWPYRWLYELLPGWQGIRAPGRLVTFASLGLALLAAAGAEGAMRASRRRLGDARLAAGVAALLALAIVIEGRGLPFDPLGDRAQPRVPLPPAGLASVPAPQLHLPAARPEDNRRYLLWSTDGFPAIVNGRSSMQPALTDNVIERARGFPDRQGVELASRLGVGSVVLHADRTKGTPWVDAPGSPIGGLPLTRRRHGAVIVYGISRPAPAPARAGAPGRAHGDARGGAARAERGSTRPPRARRAPTRPRRRPAG